MTDKPETVVEQSKTEHDVDVGLLARIVSLFRHGSNARSELERLFGAPLRLSERDNGPADESVLRRFDEGPEPDEVAELHEGRADEERKPSRGPRF
ncbi:hypothetical protein PQQ63_08230 [Paraburkholderia metrosideri]|uniref:Uncharacterized protein n=1 Tax=Paraburkholderia metrosideri TaxID=580937 RepID=A0ABW9DRN4_9BURK